METKLKIPEAHRRVYYRLLCVAIIQRWIAAQWQLDVTYGRHASCLRGTYEACELVYSIVTYL